MATSWSDHLNEEQAEQYSLGRLPAEETARCEEHLLICASCRQQVLEASEFAKAMKTAAAELEAQQKRQAKRAFRVARPIWALAAALVIGGIFFLLRQPLSTPPVAIQLFAARGAQVGAKAPLGSDLLLQVDEPGLPISAGYRLEVVDSNGKAVWSGRYEPQGVKVQHLAEGIYFARLRNEKGDLLREYGLEVSKGNDRNNRP
jgi:hypothetical protein